jgi:hypothetical protein
MFQERLDDRRCRCERDTQSQRDFWLCKTDFRPSFALHEVSVAGCCGVCHCCGEKSFVDGPCQDRSGSGVRPEEFAEL